MWPDAANEARRPCHTLTTHSKRRNRGWRNERPLGTATRGGRRPEAVVKSGVSRALVFPTHSVTHLITAPGAGAVDNEVPAEIATLARLEEAGFELGVFAVPAAVEDSFYRYNNLPPRLAQLYRDVDPLDPDEDVLEEAEPLAQALIRRSYLLDEVIDAIYLGLAQLADSELVERRAGAEPGPLLTRQRAVLLRLKELIARDWEVQSVFDRLASTFSVAVSARPLLVHAPAAGPADAALSARATTLLGSPLQVWTDAHDRVVRVSSTPSTGAAPVG